MRYSVEGLIQMGNLGGHISISDEGFLALRADRGRIKRHHGKGCTECVVVANEEHDQVPSGEVTDVRLRQRARGTHGDQGRAKNSPHRPPSWQVAPWAVATLSHRHRVQRESEMARSRICREPNQHNMLRPRAPS